MWKLQTQLTQTRGHIRSGSSLIPAEQPPLQVRGAAVPARPSECPRGAGARAGACPRAAKERGAHPDGRPPRSPPARAAGSCVGPGAGGDAQRSGLSMKGGARARQSRGWSDASGSGGEVRARAPGGRRSGTPLWVAPLALARGDSAGRQGSRSVLSGLRGWQDARGPLQRQRQAARLPVTTGPAGQGRRVWRTRSPGRHQRPAAASRS